MSCVGHNSAAYGEQIIEDTSIVLGDDHKKLFHYVQWQLSDYITGTQGMSPDQEGVYMRFLVRLYDRGQAFPDDDKMMSLVMSLDIRRWKRIKNELISFGKILVRNACLTNARFEREKKKRAEDLRKQAENTRKYWEKRNAKKATSDGLLDEVGAKSGQSPREVGARESKKVNKNNDTGKHPTSQSRVYSLESIERKKEIRPKGLLSDLPSDAPPKNRRARSKNSYTTQFEEFWKIYPRKEAKGDAFRAWKKLTIEEQRKAWAACKQQIQNLTDRMRDPAGNFCPMPATWLNGGRFDDEVSNRKLTNARYGAVKDPTEHCL